MKLCNGSVHFLTFGLQPPASLPAALRFAELLDMPARIVLRVPQRTDEALLPKYADVLRDTLPTDLRDIAIEPVRTRSFQASLHDAAQSEGGIVALQPARRRALRAIIRNDFERLLIEGPLPVLTLPTGVRVDSVRNVLFPADFAPRSAPVLDAAIGLCRKLGAGLHLLHVFGDDKLLPSEFDREQRLAATTPRDLYEIDKQSLQALADRVSEAGLTPTVATAEGRAHAQIARYAAAQNIDLIVMATHGPRSSEDILRGTTTARVVLNAHAPVLGVQS